jgi:hypothetical protein
MLPGLAHAEAAPERGAISVKYLYYKEDQPGLWTGCRCMRRRCR